MELETEYRKVEIQFCRIRDKMRESIWELMGVLVKLRGEKAFNNFGKFNRMRRIEEEVNISCPPSLHSCETTMYTRHGR